MIKFSNKFQKLCFRPILGTFSHFLGKKNFFLKVRLCTQRHNVILAPCQNLEKINDAILGRKNGRTDRWVSKK